MSNETFQGVFHDIFMEAFNLMVERQRKYGPENIRRLGLFGVFGRMSDDKIERVRRGMNGRIVHGQVEIDCTDFDDESFEDALMDIANYALIMIALKRGVWGKPLQDEEPQMSIRITGTAPVAWDNYGHVNNLT